MGERLPKRSFRSTKRRREGRPVKTGRSKGQLSSPVCPGLRSEQDHHGYTNEIFRSEFNWLDFLELCFKTAFVIGYFSFFPFKGPLHGDGMMGDAFSYLGIILYGK